MAQVLRQLQNVVTAQGKLHPMVKGAVTYALLWPTGSLIQQTLEGRNLKNYDWARALRFSLFGGLYVAPTLYGWVRLSSAMWPQTSLRVGIVKALTEQISYGPFACISFFMGMSLLERKSFAEAVEETKQKALPTYKVGICVWPFIQTLNFSLVPEHNRVVFVSICSLMWIIFLAYTKTRQLSHDEDTVNADAVAPIIQAA
ncbi:PXMP2/4 family protein 4 [Drosophila nasuta]|uniref:PXMP2/4 family protein 4 n=1 Tax=Drosophila albomicans TaxID=7291 RepID=A0A6P8XY42_DROAB|nr:PXMP2/4 family protein 4 [Drosophila albomicans]XP_060663612.1 PXMP2/4 family protein 4 [Drosophila nasuta]XP_060663613.1 PXMP2/4 family protein 4 [Drosophila nasuta]XP_060663614.1 PXMP2/4 family protein 4 [Drosophila nasuta]